jgi:hypothetical protein
MRRSAAGTRKTVLDGELIGFDAVTRLQEMKGKEIRLGQ